MSPTLVGDRPAKFRMPATKYSRHKITNLSGQRRSADLSHI
jgi:hypothetical protein